METSFPTYPGPASPGFILRALRDFRHLRLEDPIAFYELVAKLRDPSHEYFRDAAEPCIRNGLAEADGSIEPLMRKILLAAIVEDDEDITVLPEVIHD